MATGNFIIGYSRDTYPSQRNIIDKSGKCVYRKVFDLFMALGKIDKAIKNRPNASIGNRFYDFGLNKVDVIHLFNGVSYGRSPWISTFETVLPRFESTLGYNVWEQREKGKDTKNAVSRAIEAMASTSCRKLISISDYSLNMQKCFLGEYPEYLDTVLEKTVVIHPPQKTVSTAPKDVRPCDYIKYLFVGRPFFTKGGLETLKAFERAVEDGARLHLAIVSDLRMDYYAAHETEADREFVAAFLKRHTAWIRFIPSLPNDEVISLMKESHVGLLPTLSDTYGYSVLEFQSAGCPVISTSIAALREINNDTVGWTIDVVTNKFGEAKYSEEKERRQLKTTIEDGIYNIVMQIDSDKASVNRKSMMSMRRIRENHSEENYSNRIEDIYREAVSK